MNRHPMFLLTDNDCSARGADPDLFELLPPDPWGPVLKELRR